MVKKMLTILLLATTLSANAGQFGTFNGHILNRCRITTVEKAVYPYSNGWYPEEFPSIRVWHSSSDCTNIPYPNEKSRDNAFKSMQKWSEAK